MLELYEPVSAFERLAEYVAAADGDVDVFLAYGLSEPLRREDTPAPAEPCRLPLLAARPKSICVDSTQSRG